MPKIFISYRRADSVAISGRIYDRLVTAFEKANVFQDVEDIPPGVDFRKFLQSQISVCDVVLVIIGQHWLTIQDDYGRRRLDNPADFVRIEIESALKQGKVIIPILVDNATMPLESHMPNSLQELCYRNAALVRHNPDFDRDVNRLIEGIKRVTSVSRVEGKTNGKEVYDILPAPFEWIEIPAGKITLVPDETDQKDSYLKETRTFDVSAFAISKYPITNAQYEIFAYSMGGYDNEDWWKYSSEAVIWRRANSAPDFRASFDDDNPRTNVSWYEAVAFCNWLSWASKGRITLPTEQQWQRAAQGDTEWIYPWGYKWDEGRCNHSVGTINSNHPTPVTLYDDRGHSYFNVADLSGNVWEWCLTDYLTGESSLTGSNGRVLKGGSFRTDDAFFLRVDSRNSNLPHRRSNLRGFRCVRLTDFRVSN
jgi:formylglycine-generating enzyme required for sulfatase activity